MPQESQNKRIAKNTLLLYVRMLVIMVVSLYTSRVNLQSLGVQDFGIYNVVGGVVSMFAALTGALSASVSRNVTYALGKNDPDYLKKVFSTSVTIQIAMAVAIVIIAEIAGIWFLNNKMVIPADRLSAANVVMHCSIITFAIGVISVPYNACIIAHEKMSAFAYISVYEVFMKLLIAYTLYVSPIDKLVTFALLLFFLSLSLRFIYGRYCVKHFAECKYTFVYDKALIKEMSSFAGWTMFGNLAWVGYTYGVNVLLNLFFGPVVNAARGIAVQVQNAVQQFCTNFQMALNPQILKSYASGDIHRFHTLIYASSRYSFYLLYFLSLPIIIEAPMILKIWLGDFPDHTINFMRLIMVIILIDGITNPLTKGMQAYGKIKKYQIVVGGMMILIIPVAYVALKLGGSPESAFIVHLVIFAVAWWVRVFMCSSRLQYRIRDYISNVALNIIAVAVCSTAMPLIVYNILPVSVVSFFLVCALCIVSVAVSVYLIGITRKERVMVNTKIREQLNKICK